jgi:hypothetical protein
MQLSLISEAVRAQRDLFMLIVYLLTCDKVWAVRPWNSIWACLN